MGTVHALHALLVPMKTSVNTVLEMTEPQRETLRDKVEAYSRGASTLNGVRVWLGTGGLPDDWIYVVFEFADGGELHGGISPEGRMHT